MVAVGGRASVMCDSNNPLVYPQSCVLSPFDDIILSCKLDIILIGVNNHYNIVYTCTVTN